MTALDLRLHPPRPPREQLDGLVFMPRTIDKIRASLPGGHLGPYQIAPGMSHMLCTIIGVDLDALRDAVIRAAGDGDVAVWLRRYADTAQYERANNVLTHWAHADIPPEHRARFESLYPDYLRGRYPVAFDLLEADDRQLYPELAPLGESSI
jgi:Domain of unknown function (DUF5069)